MRALTRSVSASLLLAASAAAQTYEPVLTAPRIEGAPTTATPLNLGDDATRKVDLGFEFTYWGQTFTEAWVSSNGFVSFQSAAHLCCNGVPIEQAPRNTIYGFWTDLVSFSGNPYYTRGEGSILFGWYDTQEYGTQNRYTFEIGLSNDNSIRFNFGALPSLMYHQATVGITGPGAEDHLQLFYGSNTQFLQNQSGVLKWNAPQTVDCNVTPMDPSCPPESVAPIDFISSTPINTIIDAATADAAADAAEAIVESLPEPEQEITSTPTEEAPAETASITEQVAEAVAAERLTPDQVMALAAPVPTFESSVSVAGGSVQFGATQTGTSSSAAFSAAFEAVPSPSSPTSAANTLEVLNMASAPAPVATAQTEQTASSLGAGQAETMDAIAAVPGFAAYTQVSLQDRPDFYAPRDIYKNRRLRDANFEMYVITNTNTRRWQEMVDEQYRR